MAEHTPETLRAYCKIIIGPNTEGVRRRMLAHAAAWQKQVKALERENKDLRTVLLNAGMDLIVAAALREAGDG